MSLIEMPAIWRDLLAFYTLVLALALAFGAISSRRQGDIKRAIASAVIFILSFVINQILKKVSEIAIYKTDDKIASVYGNVKLWLVVFVIVLVTIFAVYIVFSCFAQNHNHIGPAAIKESVDYLPSGLAIYGDDGRCLLVNNCMNKLSEVLTGHAVLDGCELYQSVPDSRTVDMDNHKYAFSHKTIEYDGVFLHELIADDITEIYEKSQELRSGNDQLVEYSVKMRRYGETIDESVRNQEILQAKINIHDEMNRLLLATGNAASNGVPSDELLKLLNTWQSNALLLYREADINKRTNTVSDLETFGSLIGITPVWEGDINTNDTKALNMFSVITREAMTNAVKHAGAKHLYVKVRSDADAFYLNYNNDGENAADNIVLGGGLTNLKNMIEKAGGTIEISARPTLEMTIKISKGDVVNAL